MSDPTVLYCVGATKAGTTWLYRHLHEHPSCSLPAVKEAHYWDTFDPVAQANQIRNFKKRLQALRTLREEAVDRDRADGTIWRVNNADRRIQSMAKLIVTLGEDRSYDTAYAAWLAGEAEDAKLVADITPNYATLPESTLNRMLNLSETTKFVYLMRDPIDRLWSHVRMQALRNATADENYEAKATHILWRVVKRKREPHIMERGDYPATVSKLRRVVPKERLLVGFTEELFTPDGLKKLSAFLGIDYVPANEQRAHVGEHAPMEEILRPRVAAFLQHQYDWVATNVGPLPARWQDNLKRAMA